MQDPQFHPRSAPRIPDHELLAIIGAGSYGEVWLARNVFGVYRAVKIVHRCAFDDDRPFEREFNGIKKFEPISRLHPGLVDILHVGRNDADGYFYCVMELADDAVFGSQIVPERYQPKTVSRAIWEHGSLPAHECIQIGLSISAALRVLHESGLVHRDIKPSNIIFVGDTPKLADIGLVHSITSADSLVGTQGYIPPEGPGTVQADIYALGKVLYELSTGQDRQQYPELPDAVLRSSGRQSFVELNEVLVRACETRISVRYAAAADLHADLQLIASGRSLRRLKLLERRWRVFVKTASVLAIVATLVGSIGYFVDRQRKQFESANVNRVVASINYGSRLLQERNLFGALHWFVDAFAADHDQANAVTHRTRIASLLRTAPHLADCWWQDAGVNFAEFSRDGRYIAAAMQSGEVRVIDRQDPAAAWLVRHGTNADAMMVRFSASGRMIAALGNDKRATVWSFPEGKQLAELRHEYNVRSAEFSPDGSGILTAAGNGTLLLWDIASQQVIRSFEGHRETVWNASFSPDGRHVVSSGSDGFAIVWDAATGEALLDLPHKTWLYDASFSPDGRSIATACFDRKVRVWNATTGDPLIPPLTHEAPVNSVRFSPDGRYVVAASFDGSVWIWDVLAGELAAATLRHAQLVQHSSFSPDARFILTSSWDGTVRLWDFLRPIPEPSRDILSVDGSARLRFAGGRVSAISESATNLVLEAPYEIQKLWLNESGTRLLAVPREPTTRRVLGRDLATSRPLTLELPAGPPPKCVIADRAGLACLTSGSTIEIWDLERGSLLTRKEFAFPSVKTVMAPDGSRVAVLAKTNVYLVAARSPAQVTGPLPHRLPVNCAVFSRDGQQLLTGTGNEQLSEGYGQLWNPAGKPLSAEMKHGDGVIAVDFSADGKYVALGGEDFVVRVWHLASGEALPPFRHEERVYSVRFAANGRWLASASLDKTARIWDLATATPVTPPFQHPTAVKDAVLVGHRQLLTMVDGGATRTWNLQPREHDLPALTSAARFLSGMSLPASAPERHQLMSLLRSDAMPAEASEWHRDQAMRCELVKHHFGTRFHLEQLLRIEPARADLLPRLANAQAELGDYAGALKTFRACTSAPLSKAELLGKCGLLHLALGEWHSRETLSALQMLSADELAASQVVWFLVLSKSSEGLELLQKLRPHASTLRGADLALIHWRLGDFQQAARDLESDPKSIPGLVIGAALLAAAGDAAAAERQMKLAARMSIVSRPRWDDRLKLELLQAGLGRSGRAK